MKYYGFILNALGERCLFAEGVSRNEIEAELAPLIAAGLPRTRTSIVRAGVGTNSPVKCYINFIDADGVVKEYQVHTDSPRHEFLVAADLLLSHQFTTIKAVELLDNRHRRISILKINN